jgi:outer membrane protein assembly factor BamB
MADDKRIRSRRRALREKSEPLLLPMADGWQPADELKLRGTSNPVARGTLGDVGVAARVDGARRFEQTVLRIPIDRDALVGVDPRTVRMFVVDDRGKRLTPLWDSGFNEAYGFAWASIRQPGTYVPIGLPRDRVLREVLRQIAVERRLAGPADDEKADEIGRTAFQPLLEGNDEEILGLRRFLANAEVQMSVAGYADPQVRLGIGGHVEPFPLPKGAGPNKLKDLLGGLQPLPGGLPEEALFFPPELAWDEAPPFAIPDLPQRDWEPEPEPWPPLPGPFPWPKPWPWPGRVPWRPELLWPFPWPPIIKICWFFSRNWWMYHHDEHHSGVASGCSNIRSTNVGTLVTQSATGVDGDIVSIPTVVDGKIYIGTTNAPGATVGGKLYRIDLATGAREMEFPVPRRDPTYRQGIGGSPAVVGGRVYFSAVPGWIYCIDATTFTEIWRTDLRDPDPAHRQPVRNNIGPWYHADSWTSPLVVNGRVYVGCGEGEDPNTYGFVYCLDASSGDVIWLFCTNKFVNPASNTPPHNAPNVIPPEVAVSNPLPGWASSFSIHPSPVPEAGASVWSSCAYDDVTGRIFVGTGNSAYATGTDVPEEKYASGLIALDATTGAFGGFFEPAPDDSYRPHDGDIDVPGSPLVYTAGGRRIVAFGSKNGSFFLLDANTMQVLDGGARRRQLLPRAGGTGLPGDRGAIIPTVAPGSEFENEWGMYATPAVHYGQGKLFVGLGGRGAITDQSKTPFVRALDWQTLVDAWPTAVDPADNVRKYTTARPPLYQTSEVGLGSPAVVNDVVFVSTNRTALYALRVTDGLCLWSAPGLPSGPFALGPAIYGRYVVLGAGNNVYRYCL